jgi:bifunctional DNA-binding transcriptional regulator/antitoxin component of YhaV-PrlF toxin-antitoxin module
MENIGVIKQFDKLGRLVIPKELRERYALSNGVEIVATREGILLKSPEYVLMKK